MKIALAITAFLLAIIVGPAFFKSQPSQDQILRTDAVPWSVEAVSGGFSKVFGLTLGRDTLSDAGKVFGQDYQLALIAAPGETGAIEMYFDRLPTGFPGGKMIVTADISAELLADIKGRAPKSQYMESSTRRYELSPADKNVALASGIRALSFIPSINLDEATIISRFGQPDVRKPGEGNLEHFIYKGKGIDLVFDPKGKEVIQYLPPSKVLQR